VALLDRSPRVPSRAWSIRPATFHHTTYTTYTTDIQMSHATASCKEMSLFVLESLAAIVFDSLTQSCATSVFIHVHLFTCVSIPRVAGSKGPTQTRGKGHKQCTPPAPQTAGGAQRASVRVSECRCPSRSTDRVSERVSVERSTGHEKQNEALHTRRRISSMPTVLQHHNTLASVYTRALLKQLKHND